MGVEMLKHLFTALASDKSGDVVMVVKGHPSRVERAVQGLASVRRVTTEGDVSTITFKGRVDNAKGMFALIEARARRFRR